MPYGALFPFVNGFLPLVNSFQKSPHRFLSLQKNFMVRIICKYLMVIGVVLLGFQHDAFADEKDKDKKTDQSKITQTDTIKIKVNLDIQADDTLVFDDFDEDGDDDKGDNSSIAHNLSIRIISCHYPEPTNLDIQELITDPTIVDDQSKEESDSIALSESFTLTSRIYPNPAMANNQGIFVEHNLTGIARITVYTISGQIAFTTSTISKKVKIDSLTTGLYIVNISGVGNSDSKKLLVQ